LKRKGDGTTPLGRHNRPAKKESSVLHDRAWRDDQLYGLVIELDHACRLRARVRGSAVFLHL